MGIKSATATWTVPQGDLQVICMITDSRKLLGITAPHTPEVQEVAWTPAFANFRHIKKGLPLLVGSIPKHTTSRETCRKPNAHSPYMFFQVISPKLSTNSDIHMQCPHLSRNWLFSPMPHFLPARRVWTPRLPPSETRLPNASLRGLDIEFHEVLPSIPP